MAKQMKGLSSVLIALALLLTTIAPAAADEPPRLPSGFYGTATINDGNVPNGTLVSAWINAVKYAETSTFTTTINSQQVSVYTIEVPGDDPSTVPIEGGNENDLIVFKIDGYPTDEVGLWHEGTDAELNLNATVNYPPTTVSVTPTGYTSMPDYLRTIQATYQDPTGWGDLRDVYLMWNTSTTENIQQVRYEVLTRKLYIRNDANSAWVGGFTPGTNVQLSNTNMTLDVAQSSVVTTTTQVKVTWGLIPKQPATSVNWNQYLKAVDSASGSSGWVNRGTWRVNMFPNVGGLSPASGSVPAGTAQTFTTTYSDEDGAGTINTAYMRATMQPGPYTEHFKAYYNRASNRMYVYNGSAWIGGLIVGNPGTIETSYAILDVGASSVSVGAKVLTVNWNVTFKTGTEGVKDIWGYIYDNQVFQEGYVLLGHWTVGAGGGVSAPESVPPVAEDPIPLDAGPDFQPVYRTPDLDPASPASGMISPDKFNKGSAEPVIPASETIVAQPKKNMPRPLANRQPSPNNMPTSGVFTPAQGNRAPGWWWNFRAQFIDTSGYTHLSQLYVLFSMTGGTQDAIYVRYDQNTNKVYLRDSADTVWIGGYAPGSNIKISNKNGSLDVLNTRATGYSGNYLDLNPQIIFKGLGQSQHYRIFVAATDDAGNTMDWVEKGWHRVNMWPGTGGLTPSSNTQTVGAAVSYVTTYTDPEQWSDIKYAFLNVASTAGGATQGLYAYYNVAANQIRMKDDAGAWLGPITPGAAADLQNSWVIIHGAGCSFSTSGDKLTFTWNIEFKAPLAGTTKNVYLYAQDKLDWVDVWKHVGQIQITP